ncbi:MAG: tolB protein precursor, periplasmic protein involved in the tonb-independent uptake of group A colicins [uncultured Sphingomonas sp.]|uniref:TolB protein, periplasmic protein involved in the tonb-independent uptake of group A colicins n=1 Tax=uncultured Sphingomonas sp. TaxID=158754 RepID=A0A6J4SMD5_9SPHN|nr:amidohydrolase family protein [uncultured Sphingomonas sp.]CAA9502719.1 MAG: tolB protein precursor, periplasmic protein involved in the tonb-independent uptake of group A colicins [uncultured Sphingomonas sp.]
MAAGVPLRVAGLLLFASLAGAEPLLAAPATNGLPLSPGRRIEFRTDSATWTPVDVSPDGSRLITDILGDLYSLPIRGGDARRLTSGLAVDTQPVFSPDGRRIAFVSDRSGAESLWVADSDGTNARRVTTGEDDIWVSPAWSPDGKSIYASRFVPAASAYELWVHPFTGTGAGRLLVPANAQGSSRSSLGGWPTPDGRAILFARAEGRLSDELAAWTIVRRELDSGEETVLVSAPPSYRSDLVQGSFFRPVLSPDGRTLAYGSRHEGQTGLRLLDLGSGRDRWLAFPVQHDQAQASSWLDLLPRFDFTPDGRSVVFTRGAKLHRVDVATGTVSPLPFAAEVAIDLGPNLRREIKQDEGPVRARIIQHPVPSPDGRHVAFSALGRVYVTSLTGSGGTRLVTPPSQRAFMPSWSADGRTLAYVSWTARADGHVWSVPAGGGPPRQISRTPGYYTFPVFTPDGRAILAVRSSTRFRMGSYMEYGAHRQASLVELGLRGRAERTLATGMMGGRPHFTSEPGATYLHFADGLARVPLNGGPRQAMLKVSGPGWYFTDTPGTADDLRISPDGRWALAQIAQQLHLIELPPNGVAEIDLGNPKVQHRKLTDEGADFFEWSRDGSVVHWAVGSTLFSRPLASVLFQGREDLRDAAKPGVIGREARVFLPRAVPSGALLLRGATLLTMRGGETIPNADLFVIDDRIAALGPAGSVAVPPNTAIRDVAGSFIIPGLIDSHHHYADLRRGVLDFESWGPRANLAYGVTTAFDPSTLSIDTLAYEDAINAGLMLGSRMPSTGPALFSFNQFKSLEEVRAVLRRYHDRYGTRNLKQYRVGNRRVRQWIVQAARELGMLPTSEGALSLKLGLSQIIDGYPGHEHALPAPPLGRDFVQLLARSRASYTLTLQIGNGGYEGQDYFIVRDRPSEDPKLNRFAPRSVVTVKTRQRAWRHLGEYRFPQVAADAARVKRAGGLIATGAHGEMPGLGTHWEMEALVMGGMTPAEALHSATMGSAEAIGRSGEFGSLEPGKFADLVILARDPRTDIRNSLSVAQVMQGGRLYDGDSLDQLWPVRRRLPEPWFRGEDAPAIAASEFPAPPDPFHPDH